MIKFWVQEDDDWTCVSTLTGHESTVWSLAFNPDGQLMSSVSDDKTVKIWEKNEEGSKSLYSLVSTLTGYHERPIYSCSWSADGNFLATVREYDFVNLRLVVMIKLLFSIERRLRVLIL
jgi:cytosolic iron-sulfur protein assembly protein CIAO1